VTKYANTVQKVVPDSDITVTVNGSHSKTFHTTDQGGCNMPSFTSEAFDEFKYLAKYHPLMPNSDTHPLQGYHEIYCFPNGYGASVVCGIVTGLDSTHGEYAEVALLEVHGTPVKNLDLEHTEEPDFDWTVIMDDERLKSPQGTDNIDELELVLTKIRNL
jgi:hypothetical protein